MTNTLSIPDDKRIKSILSDSAREIDIYTFDSIDSTNNEAKRLISKGEKNTLLICADRQTAGRGRNGKTFYSPEKTGVYMSVVIHPEAPLSIAARATTATAVAVCEAIEELTDKKPKIKWVNDIFLENKKICGILTEAVSKPGTLTAQSLIIGVGINLSTSVFPDELKNTAGSLNADGIDKSTLIARICDRIIEYSKDLENPSHIEKYKKRCFVLGKKIFFVRNGESLTATAVDIDENGGLVIKNDNGETQTLKSGEISIKI